MDLGANQNCTLQPAAGAIPTNACQQAAAFLSALATPYLGSSAARLEIRSLGASYDLRRRRDLGLFVPRNPRRPRGWYRFDQIHRAAEDSLAWSNKGWDVYVGVLPRLGCGGKADDLRRFGFLWCEIDGGDFGPLEALQLLTAAFNAGRVFHPHLLVQSGGGIHIYWRLAGSLSCRERSEQVVLTEYLRRIVRSINSVSHDAIAGNEAVPHADVASTDPARILRVPGTHNHKRLDNPRPVLLLLNRPEIPAHTIDEWGALLPAEPLPPRPAPRRNYDPEAFPSFRESGQLPPKVLQRLSAGVPRGMIHNEAKKTAVFLRKEGLGEVEIRSFIEQIFAVSGVPVEDPAEMRNLDGLARWAVQTIQPVERPAQSGNARPAAAGASRH